MDDLLNFFRNPTPVAAAIIIAAAIALIVVLNPQHTICDTQQETLRERQAGVLFPQKINKVRILPVIGKLKGVCRDGNSSGACMEYFNALRGLVNDIVVCNSECLPGFLEIKEIREALFDGFEVITRAAWGDEPPDPNFTKNGWLQDSDLQTFCKIKNVIRRSMDADDFKSLQIKILKKVPGQARLLGQDSSPNAPSDEPPNAIEKLGEADSLNRSLFSVRCEIYLN